MRVRLALALSLLAFSACDCSRSARHGAAPGAIGGGGERAQALFEELEEENVEIELERSRGDCVVAADWMSDWVAGNTIRGGVIDGRRFDRVRPPRGGPIGFPPEPMPEPMPELPVDEPMPSSADFDASEASAAPSAAPSAPRRRSASKSAPSMATERRDFDVGGGEGDAGPSSFTTTNVQERGVDEADLVDTDGKHIYVLHQDEFLVVKSWPPDMTGLLARVPLEEDRKTPIGLYLADNDRLAVVFQGSWAVQTGLSGPATQVTVFDVSDPSAPRRVRDVEIQAQLVESRRIGSDLYLVYNSSLQAPQPLLADASSWVSSRGGDWRTTPQGRARTEIDLRDYLRGRMPADTLSDQLPVLSDGGDVRPALACNDLYVPHVQQAQPGMLGVMHMPLDDDSRISSVGILATGAAVYASKKALYVAMPFIDNSTRLDPNARWIPRGTLVHKFGLEGGVEYHGGGSVPGNILNQFSMDEHQDRLRIATTDPATGNALFVLEDVGGGLAIEGAVEGLARGEQIYAVRMFGNRGYVVTFRRTDPLYTLDLSDPTKPVVKGELKIPGYSSYIHPLGQAQLLTIGQDATTSGRVQGLHLQIFDVEDLTRPTRLHQHRLEPGASSEAELQHHAFTYDPETSTLAIPMRAGRDQTMAVFDIDPAKGFTELGRVSHADLADTHCNSGGPMCGQRLQLETLRRALIMETWLYSVSGFGMKVNDLNASLRETVSLALPVGPLPGMRRVTRPGGTVAPPVTVRAAPTMPGPEIKKLSGTGVDSTSSIRARIADALRRMDTECKRGKAFIKVRLAVSSSGEVVRVDVVTGRDTTHAECLSKALTGLTSSTRATGSEGLVELTVLWK